MSWQPSASLESLHARAQLIKRIRNFFDSRGFLEVETPVMAKFGVTDVYLSNIKARFRNTEYSLQTSPEYHMKRLLAAGSGPIFQIFRAFRDDELGRWHNPEFSMLEWYSLNVDHHGLMDEMNDFLQNILSCPPLIKKTYQQVFEEVCGVDPFTASLSDFRDILRQYELDNVLAASEEDRDQYLFLLMSHVVEPYYAEIESPLAVYDFPLSQAALAKSDGRVAQRFEIYYHGIELANGFHELTDVKAQSERFAEDIAARNKKSLPAVHADSYLLEALTQGLPACSGVALGIDRLIAIALNKPALSEIMAFDISRA